MLDFYFVSKGRRLQLQRGPVGSYLDGLATELQRESYARNSARRLLSIAGQFSHYVGLAGVAVQDIDETIAGMRARGFEPPQLALAGQA